MHWTGPGGTCFKDRGDARAHAAEELARSDPRGAHPALVDEAVVHCPIDWPHRVVAHPEACVMARAS